MSARGELRIDRTDAGTWRLLRAEVVIPAGTVTHTLTGESLRVGPAGVVAWGCIGTYPDEAAALAAVAR